MLHLADDDEDSVYVDDKVLFD